MTDEQIKRLYEMREQGIGYGKIAKVLDVSQNTVKSFCQRNKLGGIRLPASDANIHVCKFCGKEVRQNPGRKEKKFCDDKCRISGFGECKLFIDIFVNIVKKTAELRPFLQASLTIYFIKQIVECE